jgi:hypothetical protein
MSVSGAGLFPRPVNVPRISGRPSPLDSATAKLPGCRRSQHDRHRPLLVAWSPGYQPVTQRPGAEAPLSLSTAGNWRPRCPATPQAGSSTGWRRWSSTGGRR